MSDLNTEIKIGADASGVEAGVGKAKRSLKDLGDAAQKAGKDAGAGIGSIGAGGDKAAKDVERATKNMQGSLQRLLAEQKAGAKGSREYYEALADTRGISRNAIKPILDQIDAAKNKTLQAKTAADSWTASLGKVAPLVAAAFSGAAITGFLGKVVSVQREFDVLNSSLKTVTGSSAAAEREMAWLKDFAKETPFGLAQATQGFVKMKALGLDPTRAALTSFGNTASAMGKDLNQMIEAVADASTGEFERLKEFGIKAKKEGDNVSLTFQGVTTTIRNSAADITKYLEDIGNTSFGGAMEERAKTLDGTIAALGDTWDELFRTVSTNNVGGLIFDSVTLANGALEDATTILRALGGAAQDAGRDTGALSTIQSGIATVFETVAVLGANLKFVLVGIGNEIGGLAAQVAQAAQFNFSGVAAIRRAMVADAEAARKEIDATTARILNARKAQEEYARYATRNASAATDPRRVDLGGSALRATGGVSSGTAKAVKETISEYDKLIKKLSDELPKAAAEAEAAQMGYNKAQTEFLALAGSPAWASFSNSQRAVVASMFEGKIASEEAGEAAKALSKAYAEAAAERIKTIQSMERAADSLQSQNDALREEIELIGLSTEQQTLVLQQRNDVIILTKEATLAELERQSAITGTQTRVEIALASEIEALKERNALLGAKGVKNAAVDAANTAKGEWRKTTDSINQSLTDALMRGFESGKDFAKNLRDTVINMFETMVLRPVISVIVNPVAGAVTGALGLSGAANAGTGGGVLGAVGTGASIYNAGTGLAGMAGGFANGLSAWGAGGSVTGVLSNPGLYSAAELAGAMAPIALGIGAIYAIAKSIDDSGTYHTGGAAQYSAARGLSAGQSGADYNIGFGRVEAGADSIKAVGGIAQALGTALDGVAVSFGQKAGYEIATAFADDTSKDGAWGALRISKDGQELLNWEDTRQSRWAPREFGDGEEGYNQYLAAVAKDTRQVLLDMDLPSWADTMLESIGDAANMDQLAATVQQIGVIQTTFVQLGKTMEGFASLTDKAFEALMKAAGGIESLAANAGVYYENFYSASEKTAVVKSGVSADLAAVGIDMPKTREEYRALVDAQLALGESGAKATVALLAASGAFASFTPTVEQLVESVGISASQISTTIRDGLLGRISGEEMGASIGTMITNGIQNVIAGGFADQITQIFMQGIVNPVIQAAMTGSSISAAVSQASIGAMVAQAQAAAAAIGAILNDPGFQSAMAQIQDAIGSVTTASSVGYRAPVVTVGGGGYYNNPVQEAWKDLLASIVESTLAAQTELSRLGMTSYERALAEIQDKAQAQLKELQGGGYMSDTMIQDLINAETALLNARNALTAGEMVGDLQTEVARLGFTALEKELAGISDRAADYVKSLQDLGQATDANIGVVTAWEAAMRQAAIDRVDAQAADLTGGLQTEIDRLGMSDLERTLAGISDKAADYVKSLQDLGRATEGNIGVVTAWEAAMRQAAIDRVDAQAADLTGGLQTEIDRLGMSDLERTLAGISDKAADYVKSLQDLGRATEGNIATVDKWASEMRRQAQLNASASNFFGRIDRAAAVQNYTKDGEAALDKFFGSVVESAQDAQIKTTQAAASAAREAASAWSSAASSIQGAIDSIASALDAELDPSVRYQTAKSRMDALAGKAMGGDVKAAGDLAKAAQDFLAASKDGSVDRVTYLRDSVIANARLVAAADSAKAQAKTQESIAAASEAAVDQLRLMNANLTGFASSLHELLTKMYAGADRGEAGDVAARFAATQANFDSYFKDTTTGQSGDLDGYGTLKRLAGDVGSFTNLAGTTSFFRAGESVLDIAKRIPEFREIWEKEFGLKLPSFAVGTNYVPGDMTARIHEGEAIVPKAFNPWAGGANNNSEMLAELRALRTTNERLEARLASIEESNRNMETLLDNVTEGGNAMRSEVMA